ncbi:hypothetical protein V495_05436 [Pseudogymnoascus sp. VKM F-4514 (FW-929)]|nr:hypothetical protein V495_05436 [Pseudogymnoascus sp. VKM F-4514 (FW-929)]KFY52311.1 hypothetical protein V497_08557 [Pseudogymnoascus sp. VKM F-4516 (FW-969)]
MKRLETLALIICATFLSSASIGVVAKGGKGGDDGSSGGSSSSGDSGSGTSDYVPSPYYTCLEERSDTNPFWLHQWMGTYYNGTIEISASIDASDANCSTQSSVITETYNGVLSILAPSNIEPKRYARDGEEPPIGNPFFFTLDGWNTTTTEAELVAQQNHLSHLPPAVKLDFSSVLGLRESMVDPYGLVALCEVGNITRSDSRYGFTCQYDEWEVMTQNGLYFEENQFSLPMRTCNDSVGTAPFIAERNASTLLHGDFTPTSADFRWDGRFKGEFSAEVIKRFGGRLAGEYSAPYFGYYNLKTTYGSFTMRFRGEVDTAHSHEMVLGSSEEVDWVEDANKTMASTLCAEFVEVAIAARPARDLWLTGMALVSWGMLWVI